METLDLSCFTFGRDAGTDDGVVVVPFYKVPFSDRPPSLSGGMASSIAVIDRSGRAVVYDGGVPTYFTDSAAGTRDFAGWSYFEEEASEDLDGPCVQLFVLHPDYSEAAYIVASGVA